MSEVSEPMDWQQAFIATNLLVLGYNAWAGYLSGERGAIICSTNSPAVDVAGESFKTYFIRRSRLAGFLNNPHLATLYLPHSRITESTPFMLKYYLHRCGKIPTSIHPFVKNKASFHSNSSPQSGSMQMINRIYNFIFSKVRSAL